MTQIRYEGDSRLRFPSPDEREARLVLDPGEDDHQYDILLSEEQPRQGRLRSLLEPVTGPSREIHIAIEKRPAADGTAIEPGHGEIIDTASYATGSIDGVSYTTSIHPRQLTEDEWEEVGGYMKDYLTDEHGEDTTSTIGNHFERL